jgi:hypothetical protein
MFTTHVKIVEQEEDVEASQNAPTKVLYKKVVDLVEMKFAIDAIVTLNIIKFLVSIAEIV